ncbi:MAG: GNAT family N-acetyltransferase [Candidatus Eremiobacteraeota bacterium]|nr:GNAT family N-acetyltransferase [Candidatus Eremiobacteraeota bacterium]
MAIETMIEYRVARNEDLPAIAQLWLEMFEAVGKHAETDFLPDWRQRFVEYASRRMQCDELRYFVVEDAGEIVASAGALVRDGYPMVVHGVRNGYIFGVSVKPKARKRGIATTLTQQCVAWLKDSGVRRILLHASPFGKPIYDRLGFIPTNEMELVQ